MAILNAGEGLGKGDLAANAACFGLPPIRTATLLSDGQARPFGRGSFEPQEDLALARGMAPGLASLTFTQAWEGPELWFLGATGLLDSRRPLPDAFSISYGICEREIRGRGAPPATTATCRRSPPGRAGPGYDLASGLGVPRFDRLAAALPPPG